jgi:DNA-binding response OmpR family regulator
MSIKTYPFHLEIGSFRNCAKLTRDGNDFFYVIINKAERAMSIVNFRSLRILLAEDNALIGMLLTELLEHMGHEVCGVEAEESATVAAAARMKPDLMIVDAQLAQGSGVAAIRSILRSGPMPHFFISGAAVTVGSSDVIVLQKPFCERELASAIAYTVRDAQTANLVRS